MQGECKKASLLVFCRAAAVFMQKVWNYPGTPPPSVYQVTQSTALQAEYGVYRLPGTPPSAVYQVTHGTAFQAAECYVRHLSCEEGL